MPVAKKRTGSKQTKAKSSKPRRSAKSTAVARLAPQWIERRIYVVRDEKVMLDVDLAQIYGVETRALLQAVKRNIARFPADFMFQIEAEEAECLRSQIVISKVGRGGRRYLPYAFTEHGVAMLASVLRSPKAIQMNILIVRAFVRIRELVAGNQDLSLRVERLETTQDRHASVVNILADEIDQLRLPPLEQPKRSIGFPTKSRESTDVGSSQAKVRLASV